MTTFRHVLVGPRVSKRMAAVAMRLAEVIPQEAVRRGWNLEDVTLTTTPAGETWEAVVRGPATVSTEKRTYFDGSVSVVTYRLRPIETAAVGRLEAESVDNLVALAKELFEAV